MEQDINNITASDLQGATGITRDELGQWHRNGLLRIPPHNPETGRARRYGLANLIETAVIKACVDKAVPHQSASKLFVERVEAVVTKAWDRQEDYEGLWRRFYNDPRPFLHNTEFDPCASPLIVDGDTTTLHGHMYWVFRYEGRNNVGNSLMGIYETAVNFGSEIVKARIESGYPEGYSVREYFTETMMWAVLGAINEGDIVVEIRGPIFKALTYIYGASFWSGQITESDIGDR